MPLDIHKTYATDITGLNGAQAVEKYFAGAESRGLSDRNSDDRIWGHDFIHTMLGTHLASGRSEEITAIYQAVLLRDGICSTIKKPWRDGGEVPSLTMIKTKTIPKIRKFIAQFLNQFNMKRRGESELNDQEIAFHYNRAKRIGEMIHKETGVYLGEIPIQDLKIMPIEQFTNILNRVDARSIKNRISHPMLTGAGFSSL